MLRFARLSFLVATCLVSLSLIPTPTAAIDCLFVYHEHTAVAGDSTVSISGVTTLVECQEFLKSRSERFAAVTYNEARRECCGVFFGVNLSLRSENGSYTIVAKPKNNGTEIFSRTTTRPYQQFNDTRTQAPTFPSIVVNVTAAAPTAAVTIPPSLENYLYLVNTLTVSNVTIAHYTSYRFPTYWVDAKAACEAVGWELAHFPTKEMISAVNRTIQLDTPAWIGVYNGTWIKTGNPAPHKFLIEYQNSTYSYIKPYGAWFEGEITGFDYPETLRNILCSNPV